MKKALGLKIKRMRQIKDITLRELAKQTELSSSFISQVENGKTSPSLQSIKKIATVLNTTVGELLEEKGSIENTLVVHKEKRKSLKNIGKGVEIQFLSSLDRSHYMEPLIHIVEPHAISGNQSYKHEGQEFIYILNDCIVELKLGNEINVLNKGDCIYFDSNINHSFKNVSDKAAKVLCITSPPYF